MNNGQIVYKKLGVTDLTTLQELGRKTYYDAFWKMEDPENIQRYLDQAFSKEKMQAELSQLHTNFYMVQLDENVIGYLKLNVENAQTDLKGEDAMEIERIYLLEEYQGKQLGKELLNFAIKKAKKENKRFIWLGVWEKNAKAIHFYTKNGFTIFGSHPFKMGNEMQTDYLM